MRCALIAISLLLSACAGLRPLPALSSDGSLNGIKVRFDDNTRREEYLTQSFHEGFASDLRSLGAELVDRDAQFAVVVVELTGSALQAEVRASGRLVERFSYSREDTCGSLNFSTKTAEVGSCFARALANGLDRVAKANPALASGTRSVPSEPSQRALSSGKLAVLELRNFTKELSHENAQYFTDMVRTTALKMQPRLEVMTRENLLVLLNATGKAIEECEGECEVDTGRRIGADEIVSGEIQRLGSFYKLSLRLHDTHTGRLLSSTQASGKSVDELDQSAQKAAEDLLR
jgi:hypothetical protein